MCGRGVDARPLTFDAGRVRHAQQLGVQAVAASAQSHSQEDYVGTLPVSLSLMSRAEVIADLNLWNRAGLRASNMGEHSGMDDALHAQRLATYQRQLAGPGPSHRRRCLGRGKTA